MGILDPLVGAIRDAKDSRGDGDTALATVTSKSASGYRVRFDGESIASGRDYLALNFANVGDRVLMHRAGSTWVMDGPIATAPAAHQAAGNYQAALAETPPYIRSACPAVNTNASGDATVYYSSAFPNGTSGVSVSQAGAPSVFGNVIVRVYDYPFAWGFNVHVSIPSNGANGSGLNGLILAYVATGY